MTTTHWTGTESNDFYSAGNWGGGIPQANTSQEANISGSKELPSVVVANAAAPGQIHSLTIGDYGTLKITATNSADAVGDVFRAYGTQIFKTGSLIIDTPDAVELGTVNNISGTLTIMNNPGKVILDSNRLSGDGTVNLINSTLGESGNPVSIDSGMTVTLQGGSTLYTGFYASGGSIVVDPASTNTIVLQGTESSIGTRISGVSENTRFAFNSDAGETPASAVYTQNDNGSYSLTVTMQSGHTVTLSDVQFAAGYTPGAAVIETDSNGNSYVVDPNQNTNSGGYVTDPTHTGLQTVADTSAAAGGDTSQYTTEVYSQSLVKDHTSYTGQSTINPHDWNDPANWSGNANPTQDNAQEVGIHGTEAAPVSVVVDEATHNQITSLSIGDYASLTVTAPVLGNSDATVFATQGFELRGSHSALIIDTAAPVSLGTVNEIEGTLTIRNNHGNVTIDGSRLNGADGTLVLDNSILGSPEAPIRNNVGTTQLENGSTLYAGFYAAGGKVVFDDSQNTVLFTGLESSIDTTFVNVGPNTRFGISDGSGLQPVSAAYTANGDGSYTLTLVDANGKTFTLPHIYTADGFVPTATQIVRDDQNDWVVEIINTDPCFVSGTLIETENGPKAVEDIVAGDNMLLHGTAGEFAPVVWVGHQDVKVKTWLTDEYAGYPVRILAGALANGVPSRDLLVTGEHCLLLGDAFVPARMLVNGGNIFYDRSVTEYRYHHVETAAHSVLIAENTATESYLDTGNRHAFVSSMQIGKTKTWEQDAAAPLNTSLAHVQPFYDAIVQRALAAGLAVTAVETVEDPALTFTDGEGNALSIQRVVGDKYVVHIPAGVKQVVLHSRTSAPASVIGPFCDDRRELGVLVGNAMLWEADGTHAVDSHLRNTTAHGWFDLEAGNGRWTNGHGVIALDRHSPHAGAVLTVQILAAGPYAVSFKNDMRAAA